MVFLLSALFEFLYGLKMHEIKNKYDFLKGKKIAWLAGFLACSLNLLAFLRKQERVRENTSNYPPSSPHTHKDLGVKNKSSNCSELDQYLVHKTLPSTDSTHLISLHRLGRFHLSLPPGHGGQWGDQGRAGAPLPLLPSALRRGLRR